MAIIVGNTSIQFGSFTLTEKADGFEFDGVINSQGLCRLPTQAQGEVSGYTSGGYTTSARVNTIDKFPFTSDSNASDVGDLSVVRSAGAGQSSSDNGYTSGGLAPGPTFQDTIDKFPFATDSNATDVGNLTVARNSVAGQISKVSGYSSGGGSTPSPPGVTTVDKFPFATDANATDVGDLTQARRAAAGQSSETFGYSSAGYTASNLDTIDKFPFSSDTNATDVGEVTQGRSNFSQSGQSSIESGYMSGGFLTVPPGFSNVIDKFPFAADASATDVGDLTQGRHSVTGQSSSQHGYTTGGSIPPSTKSNVIDKFPFAADANATDVGDLSQTRDQGAGQQV